MTRLPADDRSIAGVDGPEYQLNLVCPVPGCGLQGTERHHIWRRSFLAGDHRWVRMADGQLVGNLVMLCSQHHHMVTVNAAWLRMSGTVFLWSDMIHPGVPLEWQPPWREETDGEPAHPDDDNGRDHLGADDPDLRGDHLDGTCPTCLRPLRQHKTDHEKPRPRRSWTVTVPKDERENGAETLDTLLEEARKEMARAGLPYGTEDTVKYFILAGALALFVQHAEDVLA